MGDYLRNGAKIGTCGRAYYATKKQLEALKSEPEAAYYLKPENGCRFAFPFPEYDKRKVGEFSNFHEGERVDYFMKLPKSWGGHHGRISHHIHPRGGQGVNLFSPCPQSEQHNGSRFYGDHNVFRLNEQVYFEGKLHVSVTCIYCGEDNILTREEAEYIANEVENGKQYGKYHKEDNTPEYNREIAARIRATYSDRISQEAINILRDEWHKMQEFINEPLTAKP